MKSNSQKKRPIIGITMGDPAGIGPEIIVSALESELLYQECSPIVLGDIGIIEKAIVMKNSDIKINQIISPSQGKFSHGTIDILNLSNLEFSKLPSKESGEAVIKYILKAVDLALDDQISAIVTAPITKTALKMAGSLFHGHTELIAQRTGSENYAMMLAGEKLKVILVTIHIPLSEVSQRLNIDDIIKTIFIAGSGLQKNFGIKRPRIAVAGLNPHAGENGMFGDEEEKIILPAIEKANFTGRFNIEGPFPPDTVFYHAANGKYDCVVCMYHDQGLIPFKLIHFKDGVNTTLGLPIIRTSVDHGTAYDIAWQNKADETSLVQAIKMALLQVKNLNNNINF